VLHATCACRTISEVRAENINLKRLGAVLAVAYERDLHDFAELVLLENLGPRTLQSLALIAEVVHGAPSRFSDPARFSFAHGGKDRYPFPVPLKTYDESLNFLRTSLDAAKVGDKERSTASAGSNASLVRSKSNSKPKPISTRSWPTKTQSLPRSTAVRSSTTSLGRDGSCDFAE
jgi:hypothetical protein